MSGSVVNAKDLAGELGVTKGRVTQWVSEGKLDGCFEGEGRDRRYDVDKCALALGLRRDVGQSMGNGLEVTRRLAVLNSGAEAEAEVVDLGDIEINPPENEPEKWVDLTVKARAISARENARDAIRKSQKDAGRFVLKTEVAAAVSGQISKIIGEIERSFIREVSGVIADEFQVEASAVKALLAREWRAHREKSAAAAMSEAEAAEHSPAELAVEKELNEGLA